MKRTNFMLPPQPGRKNALIELSGQVQCTLRIPPEYLEEIRQIANQNQTSNGGAVMLLIEERRARRARSA